MKSISDCLNIIDHAIVENVGNYIGISSLEFIHKYLLEIVQSDFIEDSIALSNVLSQLGFEIEKHYHLEEEDIKSEYIQVKKIRLVWLKERSTDPEVDN